MSPNIDFEITQRKFSKCQNSSSNISRFTGSGVCSQDWCSILVNLITLKKSLLSKTGSKYNQVNDEFFATDDSTDVILASILGYLPELTVDGVTYAQLTPILNYLYQIGKMDRFGIIKYPQYNNHLMNH